ncbi:MAG: CocE/NonD family hydrolase, partial [Planctomycetes bacterium]|nr:CocE/NonD family hydrolase [Planctomycetota bacterium]
KDEAVDGRHMHLWIAAQPWFSGELGAMGTGYGAYAACLAAEDSTFLKAMILEDCPSDLFINGGLYLEGVPLGGCLLSEINWRLQEFPNLIANLRWDDALFHLPLREVDDILGHPLAFWDECLLHPSYDYFWDAFSLAHRFSRIDTPVLHLGGWYNPDNLGGTCANFEALASADTLNGRSGRQMLVMGPWSQGVNSEEFLGFYDFTPASRIDADSLYRGWFDKWLKGVTDDTGLPPAAVRLFCLGSNEWIDLQELPPPDVDYQPFFLHSTGRAGMNWDEGILTEDPPAGFEELDSFISDPRDPVLSEMELGTDDQRPVERREDVLTFTTSPLEEDLLMVGSTQVILYMNTPAPDTDLFVMLTDVDPYGFSRPLSLGVMRIRFRDSFQAPTPVSSADINEYIIDLTPCANRFLKGHAIRLDVMGSYFPFLTRNLNSGAAIGQDSEISQAAIYLVHDFEYPSRIVIPVLP